MTLVDDTPPEPNGPVEDDRLRLIFTCCHPALALPSRVALTLRLLGGLTVADIARAFLVPETTMAQRITRAKAKIKQAHIPYRVPAPEDLPPRLEAVLAVVYLVFNEGYLAGAGDDPVRAELCDEAVRLGRTLRSLLPDEPEVAGLLALLLLSDARRRSRFDENGELVPLPEQDRGGWDRTLVAEGHAIVRECLARNRPGPYQLMAAVNAVHTDAPAAADTDWGQIVRLYDRLYRLTPTPWSPSTEPSRSPRSTAPRSRCPLWRVCRWPATTRGTRPARSCCAGSAGVPRPGRSTRPPSRRPRTPANAPT
jgi:RNA polymerase sigma-70 factor (ECF subfamily)